MKRTKIDFYSNLDSKVIAKACWDNRTIRSIIYSSCPEDEFDGEAIQFKEFVSNRKQTLTSKEMLAKILYATFLLNMYDLNIPDLSNPCWREVIDSITPFELFNE